VERAFAERCEKLVALFGAAFLLQTGFDYVLLEIGEFLEIGGIVFVGGLIWDGVEVLAARAVLTGASLFEGNEVDIRGLGTVFDVLLVSGAGGFGMGGAPFGVVEIEGLGGLKELEIFFEVGEGFASIEVFEDAGFDRSADRAEESSGVLLVTDIRGGGVLGKKSARYVQLRMRRGEEAAKGTAGGDDI
jgi:hypothetical protein